MSSATGAGAPVESVDTTEKTLQTFSSISVLICTARRAVATKVVGGGSTVTTVSVELEVDVVPKLGSDSMTTGLLRGFRFPQANVRKRTVNQTNVKAGLFKKITE